MGRDKIKSASLHGFHDEHVEPLPPTPPPGTAGEYVGTTPIGLSRPDPSP